MLILVAALLVAAGMVGAQGADVQARQLVDSMYVASGGLPIQDLVLDIDWSEAGGPNGNLVPANRSKVFFKTPSNLRIDELQLAGGAPGKLVTYIRDGKYALMYMSTGPYPVKKKMDEPSPSLLLPYFLMRYPQDNDKVYAVTGRENVEGIPAVIIKITDPANPINVVTAWVDPSKRIPLKVEVKKPQGGPTPGEVTRRVRYRDFRQTRDGRWFPFMIELYWTGTALTKVGTVKGISINTGLQDSLFQPLPLPR